MNFNLTILEHAYRQYFLNSLNYFPEKYLSLFLEPHSIIPKHVAYLCPICLEQGIMFVDSPFSKFTVEFTEDHYPPKSVGGKNTVLVCKLCNSKAGHAFDYTLQEHVQHLSFQKRIPGSAINSKSIIDGVGIFKGKMVIDQRGEVKVNLKNREGDPIRPLDQWIEFSKTNFDWSIKLQFHTPHDEKVERALLHAAYLTCFEYFGYEFIFSAAGQHMRNVFGGIERYAADVLDLNLDQDITLGKLPLGLVFISSPRNLHSMAVTIKLTSKDTGYSTIKVVLIPDPTKEGINNMRAISDALIHYTGDIAFIKLNNFLQMGELPPYRKMWATLQRDYAAS